MSHLFGLRHMYERKWMKIVTKKNLNKFDILLLVSNYPYFEKKSSCFLHFLWLAKYFFDSETFNKFWFLLISHWSRIIWWSIICKVTCIFLLSFKYRTRGYFFFNLICNEPLVNKKVNFIFYFKGYIIIISCCLKAFFD